MKAILEFNLPEDNYDYKLCNQASYMHTVLWDFDQLLRACVKYEFLDEKLTEEEMVFAQKLREKWHELLYDNKIDLHEE